MPQDPPAPAESPEELAQLRLEWEALAHEPLTGLPPEALAASVRNLATELLKRTPAALEQLRQPPPCDNSLVSHGDGPVGCGCGGTGCLNCEEYPS